MTASSADHLPAGGGAPLAADAAALAVDGSVLVMGGGRWPPRAVVDARRPLVDGVDGRSRHRVQRSVGRRRHRLFRGGEETAGERSVVRPSAIYYRGSGRTSRCVSEFFALGQSATSTASPAWVRTCDVTYCSDVAGSVATPARQERRRRGGELRRGPNGLPLADETQRASVVHRSRMSRINNDLDDEACCAVMERFRLSSKRDAVNLALRRLVAEPLDLKVARRLGGSGWHGDVDEMRAGRAG